MAHCNNKRQECEGDDMCLCDCEGCMDADIVDTDEDFDDDL